MHDDGAYAPAVESDELTEIPVDPIPEEAEREARLTPAAAVERMRINIPVRRNEKLRRVIGRVNRDDQLKAWWHVANVNAVTRMEINDHSWVHIQIVLNIALRLARLLFRAGVTPSIVEDHGMKQRDAEVVRVAQRDRAHHESARRTRA